jgi:hypothetical protein
VTRRQQDKQRISELQELTSSLSDVVSTLRQGTEADSVALLNKIRQDESVQDTARTMAAATALMMAAVPGNNTSHPNLDHRGSQAFSRPVRHRLTSPLCIPLMLELQFELTKYSMEHPDYMFETRYQYTKDSHADENVFLDLPALELDLARWTTASSDNHLLNHLVTLFWTWDNALERMMYRPLFEEDLAQADPDDDSIQSHTFCSRFLVNALLALSCVSFLSNQCMLAPLQSQYYCQEPAIFSVPDDPQTRGRRFADEAYHHYKPEKGHASLVRLQGEFAMFLYKGVLGSGKKSIQFYLNTMETFAALNKVNPVTPHGSNKEPTRVSKEEEAFSWCMWRLYCVEWYYGMECTIFAFVDEKKAPLARPGFQKTGGFPIQFPSSRSDH